MSETLTAIPKTLETADSSRCAWFPRPKTPEGKEKCTNALKITLFVVSLLALIVAVMAALVSLGMMPQNFGLNALGTIGQFASGIVVTVTLLTTVYLGALLTRLLKEKFCNKKSEAIEPIKVESEEIETTSPIVETKKKSEELKKEEPPPVKKSSWWPWS